MVVMIPLLLLLSSQVEKAYARSWSSKEECMTELVERLSQFSPADRDDAKNAMKAATFLIQRLLRDSVHAVVTATLVAEKYLLTAFVPKHK